jgi:hypothetical protein
MATVQNPANAQIKRRNRIGEEIIRAVSLMVIFLLGSVPAKDYTLVISILGAYAVKDRKRPSPFFPVILCGTLI